MLAKSTHRVFTARFVFNLAVLTLRARRATVGSTAELTRGAIDLAGGIGRPGAVGCNLKAAWASAAGLAATDAAK